MNEPLMWKYKKTKHGVINELLCTNPAYLEEDGVSDIEPICTQEEVNKLLSKDKI